MTAMCTQCILPRNFQNISFNEQGVCSFCLNYRPFIPRNENALLKLFHKAKNQHRSYDALVPLSGGKDSTYVLYLAKKKYGLNILAYTFDNGFLSDIALENIETTVKNLDVEHLFYRPRWDLLKRLYRATLLKSGELCTACGIGITNASFKISEALHIPLILLGSDITTMDTLPDERIYDIHRFKAILADAQDISSEEVEHFLIYPNLHPYLQVFYTKIGRFGSRTHPLLYQPDQPGEEISMILSQEIGWQDGGKHSDCLAEPFSNYIREHRYGYERRVAYYSVLIRRGELSRERALDLLAQDKLASENEKTDLITKKLDISREKLKQILDVEKLKYQKYSYKRSVSLENLLRRFI
jgi:hypothetical protein